VAEELKLQTRPTSQCIRGYAGGTTRAIGVAAVTLTVDLATAEVAVFVVADEVQSVSIIIGQSFLNQANVTVVLRDNEIRLFEKNLAALTDLDDLPPRKLALWAKDTVVIPPHTIGFITITGPEDYKGEVYVEGATIQRPGREYNIPRCVTTADGVLSVRNLAAADLEVAAGKLLTRGVQCSQEVNTDEVSILSVQTCSLLPFRLEDLKDQLGPNLGVDQQGEVLALINEFRDCFASNTKELGRAEAFDMHIRLNDDVPVTYRPYCLAYSEHTMV
jgi:hypothetical protein